MLVSVRVPGVPLIRMPFVVHAGALMLPEMMIGEPLNVLPVEMPPRIVVGGPALSKRFPLFSGLLATISCCQGHFVSADQRIVCSRCISGITLYLGKAQKC